jgi:hypothetical protein
MVPAVPREKPVPNVSAVSIVPIVFQHGNSDNLLMPVPSTRFARWEWPAGGWSGDLNRNN